MKPARRPEVVVQRARPGEYWRFGASLRAYACEETRRLVEHGGRAGRDEDERVHAGLPTVWRVILTARRQRFHYCDAHLPSEYRQMVES